MRTLALTILLATLPSTVLAQQAFEGTVVMKVVMDGETAEVTNHVKGAKILQEMVLDGDRVGTMVDVQAGKAFLIEHAKKQYTDISAMLQGLTASTGPDDDDLLPDITTLNRKETIAGHSCDNYRVRTRGGTVIDLCVATDLGDFGATMTGPSGFGGGSAYNDQLMKVWKAKFPTGFFPLRMRITEDGDVSTIEVVRLEKKSLSDALFQPPAGYKGVRM